MSASNVSFYRKASDAIHDPQLRGAIQLVADRVLSSRAKALTELPGADEWRDHARRLRAHTLARLDEYLDKFVANVEAKGGHVYYAREAHDAVRYVTELAKKKGLKLAVKSKSMISEEIHLNHHLEHAGVRVVETDLGEFVVQIGNDHPSHIVMPIIHKTRGQVADLFRDKLGATEADLADVSSMTQFARRLLRPEFLNADLGISGVNFGVAETGSICICTNEGNGRLVTTMPRVHVAMMGIERIVPTMQDLTVMLQVLGRSATGQRLTVYSNIINGARPHGTSHEEADGPEELHVVLLDNGRAKVLGSELAEILYCIRCGACLTACPVYRQIGGHTYGSIYPGPIGSVLTPALWGVDKAPDLAHASSLCGACREVCPVRIDIPRMLLKLRAEGTAEGLSPMWIENGMKVFSTVARRPWLFKKAGWLAALATRAIATNGWIKKMPGPISGWTKTRDFPAMATESFQDRWRRRHERTSS